MAGLVYFSTKSENTRRFTDKLDLPALRIPISGEDTLKVGEPFVLIVPTYGGGENKGAVPKQVIRFLNDADNRRHIRGVIAAGNTNFGAAFGIAGDIISAKCQVPFLYRFELLGTPQDVDHVKHGLERFWTRQALL